MKLEWPEMEKQVGGTGQESGSRELRTVKKGAGLLPKITVVHRFGKEIWEPARTK